MHLPTFDPWAGKVPWRRAWQSTPVFLPGESLGQRSLEGYSPQGHKQSDVTEATEHSQQLTIMKIIRKDPDAGID